jgi:hypothetical protein
MQEKHLYSNNVNNETAVAQFKIFFLCEDISAVNRALALKEKLDRNCQPYVLIKADFCDYARLCHPRLKQAASSRATEADMMIISAKGTELMPAFVQKWMDEASALRLEKIPCAEFLESDAPETATIFHQFMEKWASQNGSFLLSNLFPRQSANLAEPGSFLRQ